MGWHPPWSPSSVLLLVATLIIGSLGCSGAPSNGNATATGLPLTLLAVQGRTPTRTPTVLATPTATATASPVATAPSVAPPAALPAASLTLPTRPAAPGGLPPSPTALPPVPPSESPAVNLSDAPSEPPSEDMSEPAAPGAEDMSEPAASPSGDQSGGLSPETELERAARRFVAVREQFLTGDATEEQLQARRSDLEQAALRYAAASGGEPPD